MKTDLIAYLVTLIAFLGIDFVWLGRMGDILYRPVLGDILLDRFRVAPAILFYLLYAAGLVFFAVRPALASGDWTTALLNGAFLGLVAYGTYDFTNHATIKNWSSLLTAGDLAWGTLLSAVSATLGYLAVSAFIRGG